ncbi:IVa2 [Bearded dragon adenovirus 1]|uniref:IVa2 n=1 Tax=Bearded dragon adenovirus 1 TaxID=2729647 RepID=A0A6N3IR62_9ADEN|nr:IVa2 [Bearded dragon adenovirus 1]QJR83087.1 IVa2 [Bearded dragon adenovirus 1]QPN96205.1 IVa2 [Bearded dragon adenovirus 1]
MFSRKLFDRGEERKVRDESNGDAEDPDQRGGTGDAVHRDREEAGPSAEAVARPHDGRGKENQSRRPAVPLRREAPQPAPVKVLARESFLGKYIGDCLKWREDAHRVDTTICRDPFPGEDEVFNGVSSHSNLMTQLYNGAVAYQTSVGSSHHLLSPSGMVKSLNYHVQPFICVVYGPTGCGKSQFLRNVLSSQLLDPAPETVFFVTPESGTVRKEEKMAWQAQCVEGAYDCKGRPITNTLKPSYVELPFHQCMSEENLQVDHPSNVFVNAAKKGPLCVVIDECMNLLGTHRSISSFFHALPSKILGRFPQCTGYYVLVVLHNMNPRHDRGNIKDLKIQAKCHIISPQLESPQVLRFIRNYSFGFHSALISILKDMVDYARLHVPFSWLIYSNVPPCESFRWMYYSPEENLRPLYMDLQSIMHESCQAIRKVFNKKMYSRNAYMSVKRKYYE